MNAPQLHPKKPDQFPVPKTERRPLGRLLIERGILSTSDLFFALGHQRSGNVRLGHLLRAHGKISEEQLLQTLAIQYDVPFIDPKDFPPDVSLLNEIEPHKALQINAMPWAQIDGVTLVATSDPANFDAIQKSLPPQFIPVSMILVHRDIIESFICQHRQKGLIKRAEELVPEELSCRNLPDRIKTLLALAVPTVIVAFSLQWITFAALYRAIFTFAAIMVFVGIFLKTAASALQLLSRAPSMDSSPLPSGKRPRVSILIPLHDESDILDALLRRIGSIKYPKALLEVLLVVEETDESTRAHLSAATLPNWMRTLVVPTGRIMTKPRAMNYALPFCQGDIIGIYDAEDSPDPQQISDVVTKFASAGDKIACVQAVLDFYNPRANAMSRFFTIEYATWFRLILPGVARLGFPIPLGGTSVFFRRTALEELHGWDAHNVTEDADLGIRLARSGYETALITSVTQEEANNVVWPWIKQRSRWLKGYLITYLTHMRSPMRLLFELGAWKFMGFQVFFLSSICQYLLAPFIWSTIFIYLLMPSWLPIILPKEFQSTLFISFFAMWVLSSITFIIAVAGRDHRHLIPWTLWMTPYLALGTLAIYKGAWELITKPFYWDKTAHGHSNADQDPPPSKEVASSLSRVTKATEM